MVKGDINVRDDSEIAEFLLGVRTIAVVGLSENPAKDSHRVASYLQAQGYEIIPVNPLAHTVLGRPAKASLREIEGRVDLVDVFRKSEEIPAIVEDAIAIGARGVWLQSGLRAPEAEKRARSKDLFVMADRCLMAEHRRLLAHSPVQR